METPTSSNGGNGSPENVRVIDAVPETRPEPAAQPEVQAASTQVRSSGLTITTVLGVLLVASIALNVFQFVRRQSLESQVGGLESALSESSGEVENFEATMSDVRDRLGALRDQLAELDLLTGGAPAESAETAAVEEEAAAPVVEELAETSVSELPADLEAAALGEAPEDSVLELAPVEEIAAAEAAEAVPTQELPDVAAGPDAEAEGLGQRMRQRAGAAWESVRGRFSDE